MKQYVINTGDVIQLLRELASNVIGEKQIELQVSDSSSTRTIWFISQDATGVGFTGLPVVQGLASTAQDMSTGERSVAQIELDEDGLLVLVADL